VLHKIKVDEFSIGFGPRLLEKRFKPYEEGGVNYVLRVLPFGGYVSFPRFTEEEEEEAVALPPARGGNAVATRPPIGAQGPHPPLLMYFLSLCMYFLTTGLLCCVYLLTLTSTKRFLSAQVSSPIWSQRLLCLSVFMYACVY